MVSFSRRPFSVTGAIGSSGETFRMLGSRRKLNRFRYRVMVLLYLMMGCIIPYYVMKHAEEEQFYQQQALQQQQQNQLWEDRRYKEVLLRYGGSIRDRIRILRDKSRQIYGYSKLEDQVASDTATSIKIFKRKAFFEDLSGPESLLSPHEEITTGIIRINPPSDSSALKHNYTAPEIQRHLHHQNTRKMEVLQTLGAIYDKHHEQISLDRISSVSAYQARVTRAIEKAMTWVIQKIPPENIALETRILGTRIDTVQKTRRFRQLMTEALDSGQWVYEPDRDYPDFGGATAWSKKKQNERDRDVAIDRPPFPEAGKYHWEPFNATGGWHSNRILPEEFCRILGTRHILLIGDVIHWQLHDSIMYNMFDTPQICYGEMACHLGVGHPLCPLPNDVRLKFVRNDLHSPIRVSKDQPNEIKTQDPVEISWLKDLRSKDTIILGATHQTLSDRALQRLLTDTINRIRKTRPDALIIYRNNPVGHPDCPSKANGYNTDPVKRMRKQRELRKKSVLLRKLAKGAVLQQQQLLLLQQQEEQPPQALEPKIQPPISHNGTTFAALAKPFTENIPLAEMLHYPLNWAHYDRQNHIAKTIIEASGGIYWNVATMTNMRPDGHVGGQDCLSYKRPGPTDEWAVSLFNLFKTIEVAELNKSL
ncbi:hypothetical protein FBU30_007034 [Linnemannia zychae]|nr:hypothetical protein FBU30_007034 [Linnemannia zychae]